MSTFILLSFAEHSQAQAAYDRVHELSKAAILTFVGAATLTVEATGEVVMTKASYGEADKGRAVQTGAFGLILGSLVLAPVLGFAAGGVIGDVFEAHEKNDELVHSKIRRRVTESMNHGRWVLAIYATDVAEDEFERQVKLLGGTHLASRLSTEDDVALARVLGAA